MTFSPGSADWNYWSLTRDYESIFAMAAQDEMPSLEIGIYEPEKELTPEKVTHLRDLSAKYEVPIGAILLSLTPGRWPSGAFTDDTGTFATAINTFFVACDGLNLATANIWTGADGLYANLNKVDRALGHIDTVATRFGLTASLEYKPETCFPNARKTLEMVEPYSSLRVLLDTGHAYALGEDPEEVLSLLIGAKRLGALHLGDAGIGGADDDLPCGTLHDFTEFVLTIEQSGVHVPAHFDLYGACSNPLAIGPRECIRSSAAHISSRRRSGA